MYMYVSVTQADICNHAALARAVAFSSKTCYCVRTSSKRASGRALTPARTMTCALAASERASTDPGAAHDEIDGLLVATAHVDQLLVRLAHPHVWAYVDGRRLEVAR